MTYFYMIILIKDFSKVYHPAKIKTAETFQDSPAASWNT